MLFKIALRNVLRQKRRSLFTILTMVVGFAMASVMTGWQDGSYNTVIDTFTRAYLGHIQIHSEDYFEKPSLYKNIEDYESVGEKLLAVEGVESWAPRLTAAGLASVGDKSTAIRIVGIDPDLENAATSFDAKVKQGESLGSEPSYKIVIGKGLTKTLGATFGDSLVVVSQAADGSIANDIYEIVGIAETGDEMSDRMTVYMHLADAQELMVLENRAHEIVVMVTNIKKVKKTVGLIETELAGADLEVLPWQKVSKAFYDAMQADRQGNDVMWIIIMMIVAIGVLNTVLMAVLERTREFGVLKALGTRPAQIFKMVMAEVLIMAVISIVVGAIIGTTGNYILSVYGITFDTEIDVAGVPFDTMKAEINAKSIVMPTILVMLAAMLVSVFPAIKAARIAPSKAMRFH